MNEVLAAKPEFCESLIQVQKAKYIVQWEAQIYTMQANNPNKFYDTGVGKLTYEMGRDLDPYKPTVTLSKTEYWLLEGGPEDVGYWLASIEKISDTVKVNLYVDTDLKAPDLLFINYVKIHSLAHSFEYSNLNDIPVRTVMYRELYSWTEDVNVALEVVAYSISFPCEVIISSFVDGTFTYQTETVSMMHALWNPKGEQQIKNLNTAMLLAQIATNTYDTSLENSRAYEVTKQFICNEGTQNNFVEKIKGETESIKKGSSRGYPYEVEHSLGKVAAWNKKSNRYVQLFSNSNAIKLFEIEGNKFVGTDFFQTLLQEHVLPYREEEFSIPDEYGKYPTSVFGTVIHEYSHKALSTGDWVRVSNLKLLRKSTKYKL